jgi:hypothetical protein
MDLAHVLADPRERAVRRTDIFLGPHGEELLDKSLAQVHQRQCFAVNITADIGPPAVAPPRLTTEHLLSDFAIGIAGAALPFPTLQAVNTITKQ